MCKWPILNTAFGALVIRLKYRERLRAFDCDPSDADDEQGERAAPQPASPKECAFVRVSPKPAPIVVEHETDEARIPQGAPPIPREAHPNGRSTEEV